MLYLRLLQNQRRRMARAVRSRYRWLGLIALSLLGSYLALVLVGFGFLYEEMTEQLWPGRPPVETLHEYLLTVFASLFAMRLFLQRSPGLDIRPYLHLPIPRARLVRFFQVSSLASVHNLFPLLFFVPFWYRYILRGGAGPAGAACWLIGIVAIVVLSHYGNTVLRALGTRSIRQFFFAAGGFFLLMTLDQVSGTYATNRFSYAVFDVLHEGNVAFLLLLVILAAGTYLYASLLLTWRLLVDDGIGTAAGRPGWQPTFRAERGAVPNLMLLEGKLMWRNQRPRFYLMLSLVFGSLYVLGLLLDPTMAGAPFTTTLTGLFASGIFALNYGQLMFAWESAYFDGYLVRGLDAVQVVQAKLLVLQASCLAFFVLNLPLFLLLAPDQIPVHLAFLLYNAGVTSLLMVALAIQNRKRVDLRRSSFLNYEGFSLVHFLWFIPTVIPPFLLLLWLQDAAAAGLAAVGGLGAAGLLLSRPFSTLLARRLARRRYLMAAGFRQS